MNFSENPDLYSRRRHGPHSVSGKKPLLIANYRRAQQLGPGLIPSATSGFKVGGGITMVDPRKARELIRERSQESKIGSDYTNRQEFSSKKLHMMRKGMGHLQDIGSKASLNDVKP